jgi:hypothetical protein
MFVFVELQDRSNPIRHRNILIRPPGANCMISARPDSLLKRPFPRRIFKGLMAGDSLR